jgi:putative ABC transport system ATP-binding protein/lipoprotein-releasing system ATP-binding protein
LLLADEPTGQVDHATAAVLVETLLEWAREDHAAVLIATHDLAVARRMDRVWTMEHGILATTDGTIAA